MDQESGLGGPRQLQNVQELVVCVLNLLYWETEPPLYTGASDSIVHGHPEVRGMIALSGDNELQWRLMALAVPMVQACPAVHKWRVIWYRQDTAGRAVAVAPCSPTKGPKPANGAKQTSCRASAAPRDSGTMRQWKVHMRAHRAAGAKGPGCRTMQKRRRNPAPQRYRGRVWQRLGCQYQRYHQCKVQHFRRCSKRSRSGSSVRDGSVWCLGNWGTEGSTSIQQHQLSHRQQQRQVTQCLWNQE